MEGRPIVFYKVWRPHENTGYLIKTENMGFPGGAVVKNPPANAGDMGSSPGPGKIPHAAEQLSLCATTTEPAL